MGLDLGSGELIAAKVIELVGGGLREAEEWEQIQNEIDVMKKVQHPNIVRYVGSTQVIGPSSALSLTTLLLGESCMRHLSGVCTWRVAAGCGVCMSVLHDVFESRGH